MNVKRTLLLMLWLLPLSYSQMALASIPYASCFARSASDYRLSEELLIAVSAAESNWNANARSHANAHGLMQIQWPGTARHLGVRRVSDLYKPCTNIDLGARYLRELLDAFEGDEQRALAAYNYGPSRIRRAKTLPAGALRYIAQVDRQRRKLQARNATNGKSASTTASIVATGQSVLTLKTRARAQRYVRILNGRVRGARFSHAKSKRGQHAIVMAVNADGLSANDLEILKTFGWQP